MTRNRSCTCAAKRYRAVHINLGRDYLVWDKYGSIEYVAPGRGTVRARFELAEARIAEIRAQASGGEKVLPEFQVEVRHLSDDSLVALVRKTLYVRLKPRHRSPS